MLKHHKGLYLLFFTEMWERFAYYGMRALLVLYMIQQLLYSTSKAGNIYGLYTGLVYLTPILGGYIADRILGQRRCITLGAVIMLIGLLFLSFGGKTFFIFSLFLMIIGNGFFKSNISSVLGMLYSDNPEKKDNAYTIFYMGINLGAFLSPLICGTVAVKYGYNWGFLSAGIGMFIGLLTYKIFENKYLSDVGLNPVNVQNIEEEKVEVKENEKEKMISLFVLMLFTILFWVCFEQAGCSLTLFAEYSVDRKFLFSTIPTGYFQSLNPLFIIILAPFISCIWEFLNKRGKEPTSVEKFGIALLFMSVAFLVMTVVAKMSYISKVSPLWLVVVYFIMTVSELCLSPIGLSLVSKLAPVRFLSLIMGCWFLTSFFGNMLAGFWGGLYGHLSLTLLFFIPAVLLIISLIILMIFLPSLNKKLK